MVSRMAGLGARKEFDEYWNTLLLNAVVDILSYASMLSTDLHHV